MVNTKFENKMINVRELPHTIKIHIANGEVLSANKKGILKGMSNGYEIDIEAIIVDKLSHNLLSVNEITRKGYIVNFNDRNVKIMKNGRYLEGKRFNNLYIIEFNLQKECAYSATNDKTLWTEVVYY